MASSQRSSRLEGRIDPRQVTTPLAFTRYAAQRLGCEVPVGGKQRGVWYGQLAEEMEANGWEWGDLLRAIDYCVENRIRVRKVFGVLYYVAKAMPPPSTNEPIHALVARALADETDETWKRRLSLATGKALERVYSEWVRERSHAVRG